MVEGNVYYFPANQKYYYCLKSQSGRTSVPNADFEEMSIWANKKKLENLVKFDSGITGNYTTLGSYTYNFPKSYKQVLGVAINIYKTGTATTLENVYLSGFNNAGFTFVKDCVDNSKANTVKIAYTVFYI